MNNEQLTLKIAFASDDKKHANQHFGSCPYLAIYTLTRDKITEIESINFELVEGNNKLKIRSRLTVLKHCFAVYCLGCGNPVRQQLLAQGTRTVIKQKSEPIEYILKQVQKNWPETIAIRQQQRLIEKQDQQYYETLANSQWN